MVTLTSPLGEPFKTAIFIIITCYFLTFEFLSQEKHPDNT
jgi:hypothetical protein